MKYDQLDQFSYYPLEHIICKDEEDASLWNSLIPLDTEEVGVPSVKCRG